MNKSYKLSVFYVAVVLLTAVFFPTQIFADETKSLWERADESRVPKRGSRTTIPDKYLVFRLNQNALQAALTEMPLENSDAARTKQTVIEIPQPDGTIERFRIEETQVLSPQLAAQYPTWKTFVGYGIDNPQAVGRFDWNIQGFHGYIESGKGTVLIDPYQKGDTKNYLVFYKHEYGTPDDEFSCKVKDDMSEILKSDYKPDFLPNTPEFAFGATLRTYRIAIATTGEWSRNASGFDSNPVLTPQQIRDGALAVVVTTLNRLTGIFIRELGSSFQLVNPPTSSSNNIIFDDPTTDPYNNIDSSPELDANQSTLDTRVGTANYDIGHLYGTDGGGVASSPGLCRGGQGPVGNAYPNNKAKGYSARGTNTGDPFTVDYVAHEIGHQFGAGHTYNNVDPSGTCTTRSATNAFEVASGATIMSYVGICGARNLQQFVDAGLPSFHIRSLTQIDFNIRTDAPSETPGCGPTSGTNAVPTVNAGASFNIPKLTPFTLTATGGDTDDPAANLLYSWEQYDLAPLGGSGTSGTPAGTYDVDTDGVARPLFRVYSPVSSSSRVYPSLNFILNPQNNDATADVNGVRGNQPVLIYQGTHPTNAPGAVCKPGVDCVIGERLPTINRTMNFRVSLRDRRGGVQDAGTTVTVAGNAGPFQITNQNSFADFAPAVTWQAGTTQIVTWDVANTNIAPVSAQFVNILLSTDGGQTFPVTILANTPNDGTQSITVPNNPTTQARIKIEPVGNIFFDISNVNFTITAPTAAGVSISGRVLSSLGRGVFNARIAITDQNGDVRTARTNSFGYYRFDDVAAGQTYIFNVTHKRYRFSPRVISIVEDTGKFDFIAEN